MTLQIKENTASVSWQDTYISEYTGIIHYTCTCTMVHGSLP